MNDNKNLINLVNLAMYCETCPNCKQPARGEQYHWDLNETILDYFCINPRCINFDGSYLRHKREELEKQIRAGKQQDLMWKDALKDYRATGRLYN